MCKKEEILLDAVVCDTIDLATFRAELKNGHRIIAFLKESEPSRMSSVAAGDRVRVSMSPFDMSKGEIVSKQ